MSALSFREVLEKGFNKDQPRDEKGRWASGGGTLAEFSSTNTATGTLNGVPFNSWQAPTTIEGWAKVEGQSKIEEPPFEPVKGKSTGAGVIIREPDGRVWMVKPSNGYGGYKGTFPKGTLEEGLSLQATAIKEAWEESGLKVKITGFAGDYERDTSKARYYFAERTGGTPSDHGNESEKVVLVPPARAHEILNRAVDRQIAHETFGAPKPPPEEKPKGAKKFEDTWGSLYSTAKLPHVKLNKAASFEEIIKGPPTRAVSFSYIAKASQVEGNLCRGPDGKYVACGILANAPKPKKAAPKPIPQHIAEQHEQLKSAVHSLAAKSGVPAPKKSIGSATNSQNYLKATGLIVAASSGDIATLDKFIAAHGEKKGTLTQNLVGYAKELKAAHEAKQITEAKAPEGPKLKSIAGWKQTGGQLGSNAGGVYEDEKGGKWYVKFSKSDDHAKSEHLAGKLYALAGAPTTNPELVDVGGGKLGIATRWQKTEKFNVNNGTHRFLAQEHFATHAWTANYDAVGAAFDNQAVVKNPDGSAHIGTMDVGGALIYRAQGALKSNFDGDPKEFHSMRDPKINPNAAKTFGDMTSQQLANSIHNVKAVSPEAIKAAVMEHGPGDLAAREKLAAIMIARRESLLKTGAEIEGKLAPAPVIEEPPQVRKPQKGEEQVATKKTPPASVKPGMPNFEKVKLPPENVNAASHNKKIDAIKALAESGNAEGILAMQYGIGNYSKKQVATANEALAAMGIDEKVQPGQKKGQHPAVSGKPWAIAAATQADATEKKPEAAKAQLVPEKISKPPSFSNWQGTGKGLSSNAANNEANEAEAHEIWVMAVKGDLEGLKAYQPKSPSKHVASYKEIVEQELDEMLNPPEPLKLLNHVGGDINRLAEKVKGKPLGTKASKVAKNEQVGYFIALGVAKGTPSWDEYASKAKDLSEEFKNKAPSVIKKLSPAAKAAVSARQAGNSWADKVREGKLSDKHGQFTVGEMAEAMNKESVELPAYTKLYRYFSMPPGAQSKVKSLEPGTIIQDMNPACTTYQKGATTGFGSHEMEIITLPGAKAMPSFGSGQFKGEHEVTMQAGWRMMVLGVEDKGGGALRIKATLLPPG